MKILVSRLSFGQIGGAELSARDITRSLIGLGHQPLFITNLINSQVTDNLPIESLKKSPQPFDASTARNKVLYPVRFIYSLLWYLIAVIRFKPDIIHPHSRQDQLFLTIVGFLLRIPVVWRDPGDLYPQLTHGISGSFQKLNRRLQIWGLKHTDHIITLNNEELDSIKKIVPELNSQKLSVIGSDIMFDDYTVSASDVSDGVVTIGTASRLDEHKGIQYAIEAFKAIAKSHSNIQMIIAGDGSYRSQLEELATGVDNVRFIGHQENLSDFYNELDIFIQPALFEGWGRNIKEAKLFSLPIIGSRVGGIQVQITDSENGLLFTPGDIDDLAKKLGALVSSRTRREELGIKAHRSAVAEGDWVAKVEKQYIPLFERYLI